MNLEPTPEFEPKTFSYRECALPVVAEIADFDLNSTARSVALLRRGSPQFAAKLASTYRRAHLVWEMTIRPWSLMVPNHAVSWHGRSAPESCPPVAFAYRSFSGNV